MRMFKKDKEEEEYEEEEEIHPRKSKRKVEFRDLNPENKRKRKEPKKPWGRRERLLVLSAILLTAGTSGLLSLSARSWKLPGLPRIGLPAISVPFIGEETIYIKGSNQDQRKAERIIASFEVAVKDLSGIYGLYVADMDSGFSYGVNDEEIFQAASLIKLPVMVAMYMEEEKGEIDLDSFYTLKNSDKVSGAGSLYNKPSGYQISYRNLIQLMGKQSDNTAFNVTRKILGDEKINDVIASIGMVDTSLSENETTPKDVGIFFERLWNGDLVNEISRDEILDALTDTLYEDWLVAGIPEGTTVSHKYGREVHVVNDAGIVFSDQPYVVVLMSKGIIEDEADDALPMLSRLVWEAETGE